MFVLNSTAFASRRVVAVFVGIILIYAALSGFLYLRWNSQPAIAKAKLVVTKLETFLSWRTPIKKENTNVTKLNDEPDEPEIQVIILQLIKTR